MSPHSLFKTDRLACLAGWSKGECHAIENGPTPFRGGSAAGNVAGGWDLQKNCKV